MASNVIILKRTIIISLLLSFLCLLGASICVFTSNRMVSFAYDVSIGLFGSGMILAAGTYVPLFLQRKEHIAIIFRLLNQNVYGILYQVESVESSDLNKLSSAIHTCNKELVSNLNYIECSYFITLPNLRKIQKSINEFILSLVWLEGKICTLNLEIFEKYGYSSLEDFNNSMFIEIKERLPSIKTTHKALVKRVGIDWLKLSQEEMDFEEEADIYTDNISSYLQNRYMNQFQKLQNKEELEKLCKEYKLDEIDIF